MMKPRHALLLLLLAGCTVGPDYQKPEVKLPESWISKPAPAPDAQATVEQEWWKHFNDPMLNQLIDKALTGNYDLQIAQSRISESRATRSSATVDLLPVVNTTGTAIREGNRLAFPSGSIPIDLSKPFNNFQAGFDASWELDVFGRKRREIESDTALLEGAQAALDDARISLLAEVARTYVEIREYQRQIALTEETVKAFAHTGSIVKEQVDAGNAPAFNLTQARALLEQAQSQLPYYQNFLAQAEFGMDVLTGEQPGVTATLVVPDAPGSATPIPVPDKTLVLAAPAQVIANRPDIRLSERQLASATAQQGVATAQLFPDISISGFFGLLSADSGNFLEGRSKSWDASGNLVWPILNYYKLRANIDAADAREQTALASYKKTVIAGLSDVERALTAYVREDEHRAKLAETVADNAHAADIAEQRYKEGLSTFLEVLDARRTLYDAQSHLTQVEGQAVQNLVAVYKSLGGGWKQPPATGEKST